MANGITVYFVDLTEKDPSELGFEKILSEIHKTDVLSNEKLMMEKLLCTI